jgi:hypothetical protein
MLRALKTELVYFGPWMLGGLAIASFVSILLIVLTVVVEDSDGVPGFVIGMFPVIAGMVVAFIAQSYRSEERRARLLLSGPMVPAQLAVIMAVLPACLVGAGALYGVALVAGASLIVGSGVFEHATAPSLGLFAVQFWAYAQMGPLAQESTAAYRQQRGGAALGGWVVFVGSILFLIAAQFTLETLLGRIGLFAVIGTAVVVSAFLFAGRNDFTR